MAKKIADERIIFESNKVYKTCFFSLCIAIFVTAVFEATTYFFWSFDPLVSKEGFYISGPDIIPFYIVWGLEALALAGVFMFCIFSLAKKGITVRVKDSGSKKFPAGRYAVLSLIISSVFFVCILASRFITSFPLGGGYGLWGGIAILTAIYVLIAVPVFVLFYLVFYAAFKIAKSSERQWADSE